MSTSQGRSRGALALVFSVIATAVALASACTDEGSATSNEGDADVHCYYVGLGCNQERTCQTGRISDDACLAHYCACSGQLIGGCSKLSEPVARLASAEEIARGSCAPSTEDADARASSCSNGPRWPRGTQFPSGRAPANAPACVPHCGDNAPASDRWPVGTLTSEALPSGACSDTDRTCTMTVEVLGPCDGGIPKGPMDLMFCECKQGNWSCAIDDVAPSATIWTCDAFDASTSDAKDGSDG